MQDRVETTQNERSEKRHWRIPELAVGLVLMLGGAHEELFALRMKAHALRGDSAGVRFEFDSYQRAINSDSFSIAEPSQKLVNLLNNLTNSHVAKKSVALTR